MSERRQRRQDRRDEAGFTLLEVLAALAILAIGVALAMPLTRSAGAAQALRHAASDVAAMARMARASAVRSGAERIFIIDGGSRRLSIDDGSGWRPLPSHVDIEISVAPGQVAGDSVSLIRFLPGGGSSGGRVVLRHGSRTATVEVDWLTGGVRVGHAP